MRTSAPVAPFPSRISRRCARGGVARRSWPIRSSTSSITARPFSYGLVRSASSLSVGSAFPTATPNSATRSIAWSFSASPIAATLRGESPSSSSAAARPLALFNEAGRIMTAPLLKITLSSSPRSRIASRTIVSCGCTVATIERPTDSGSAPRRTSSRTSSGDRRIAQRPVGPRQRGVEDRPVLRDHPVKHVETVGRRRSARRAARPLTRTACEHSPQAVRALAASPVQRVRRRQACRHNRRREQRSASDVESALHDCGRARRWASYQRISGVTEMP